MEAALEAPPHLLRRWVSELEPFATRPTEPRCANEYSVSDLAFLFAVKMLIASGLSIETIKPVSADLYKTIARPAPAGHRRPVYLLFDAGWSVADRPTDDAISIQVPIWKAWESVNRILNVEVIPLQGEMKLGLADIARRPRAAGRRS
ncbi:MAG: hypothetical protein ACT4PG_01125 [Panacagrimonas sp.]